MKKIPLVFLVSAMAGCAGGESDQQASGGGAKLVEPLGALGFAINFTQKPHTDELNCHYIKTRNESPTEVRRVQVKFPAGSHHVHIYRSSEPEPSDYVVPCTGGIDWNRWRLVVGVQTENIDWTLPDGVSIPLDPHQQLLIQVHWVNISNDPVSPSVQVDFEPTSEPAQKHLAVGFGVAEDVRIDPHQKKQVGGWVPLPDGAKVIAMMGHFHERGEGYRADVRKRGSQGGRSIYEAGGEQTFVFRRYETPEPVGNDEGVAFICDINNFTQKEITYGANVADQEHCNVAVYYEPPELNAESKVYSQGFVRPADKETQKGGGLTTSTSTTVAGDTVMGTVELNVPAGPVDVEVLLRGKASRVDFPRIVKIPAWQQSASFPIRGLRPGTDVELFATTTGGVSESTSMSFTGLALSEITYTDDDPNLRWVEVSNYSNLPVNLCEYSLGAGTDSYADFARSLADCKGDTPIYLQPSGCLVVGLKGMVSNPATGMMVVATDPFGVGFSPPADGALGVALIDNVLSEWVWDPTRPPKDEMGTPKLPRPPVLDAVAIGTTPNPNLYDQSEANVTDPAMRKGMMPLAPLGEGAHERRQPTVWNAVAFKTPGICRVANGN